MSFASALPGPMLILVLLYFMILVMLLIRTAKLRQKSTYCTVLAQSLYWMIIVLILFRLAGFIFMCIFSFSKFQIPELSDYETARVIINLSFVPDIIFWDCFALLLVHLLAIFYQGHMQVKISFEEAEVIPNRVTFMHFLTALIGVWDMGLVMALLLFNLTVADDNVLLIIVSVSNMSIPLVLFIAEVALQCKFSGVPYRSIFHFQRKRKLNVTICLWAFTRVIHFFMDVFFRLYEENSIMEAFNETDNSQGTVVFICAILGEKIITEILPLFLLLDNEVIDILGSVLVKTDQIKTKDCIVSLLSDESDSNEISINKTDTVKKEATACPNQEISVEEDNFTVDPKKISFEGAVAETKKQKNKFGIIRTGYIQPEQEKCLIRVLQNVKLTRFVQDDLNKDFRIFREMSSKLKARLSLPLAYSYKDDTVYLIYPHSDFQSLSTYLANVKNSAQLSYENKVNLMFEIARTLGMLYEELGVGHGHLSPNNIMFNDKLHIKISDVLLQPLKKYYTVFQAYSNKSLYTAPELLAEKGNIVLNFSMKADIYSFGMIMYEIFTEKNIFEGLGEAEAKKLVLEEGRPKLPDGPSEEVKMLIRQCWQTEAEKRPTFAYVQGMLQRLKPKNDGKN